MTHDIELKAIIHVMKMFINYLLGRRFTLMSDHIIQRYIFNQPNLNVMKARWLANLSEFEFEIRHIKVNENRVANSLSRRV